MNRLRNILFLSGVIFETAILSAASLTVDLRTPKSPSGLSVAGSLPDGVIEAASLPKTSAVGIDADLSLGDELSFLLFQDVEIKVKLIERMESPLSGDVFIGEIEGCDGAKSAVAMQTPNGMIVELLDFKGTGLYKIISTADGVTVQAIDQNAGVRKDLPALVPEEKPSLGVASIQAAATDGEQSSTLVDVLVVYEAGARIWADANGGGITNFAEIAVQKMNTAMANTGLNSSFRFRLVGVKTVDVTDSDFYNILPNVASGSGNWSVVPAYRTEVGADVVCVLADTGSAWGTVGLGFALQNQSIQRFSESAYNVSAIRSVAQSHTMTHETGHNMGAGHSNMQATQTGPQLYNYSSGYYFTAGDRNYCTIMAYTDDGYGNFYTEIPYFSSPNYTYQGVAVGTDVNDNTRTIRETCNSIKNFRAQKIPLSYDVFFSPEGGSIFKNTLTVTLTSGKPGLPIYYTLDGSTPTIASTRYISPITVNSTTTIKAISVTDNVPSPVYSATYTIDDLTSALNAPQLEWTTDSSYPWSINTEIKYDGVASAASGIIPIGRRASSWISTTVTGPKILSFYYKALFYQSSFSVFVDNAEVMRVSEPNENWTRGELKIPAGTHTVKFQYSQLGYTEQYPHCGVVLDAVQVSPIYVRPKMYLR